jgi:hypothetical protein
MTVGTGVEHVDIGSGNLIANFPILSLPGRHMPFNYGLRYNALFWTIATRTQPNGQQVHFWSIERRPYIGGIDQGLGFTPTLPLLSWGLSTETCENLGGVDPPDNVHFPGTDQSTLDTARDYLYTDAGGGKHPLGIVQYVVFKSAFELRETANGKRAIVAGSAIMRQRPGNPRRS